MTKEALVIIPGFDAKEVGFALSRTVDSISKDQSIASVSKVPTPEQPNIERLEITDENSGEKKLLDVYEVFWGDIIIQNYKEDAPVWQKVIFGLELMFFWFFSPIWKAAYKNKWMFTGIAFSGIIITFWYISILGVFISALDGTQLLDSVKSMFMEPIVYDDPMRMGLSVQELPRLVSKFFTEIFLFAGLFIGLFPSLLSLILRVSGFGMKFIKSPMVRDDVKNRIQLQMNAINKDDSYDRVTLLSHSLGVIPTLDFLSGFKNQTKKKVRFITIGSPVSFLANKAKVFRTHANEVIKNEDINEWADFYSKGDWLCSYEKLGKEGERVHSNEIQMDSSWMSRMSTAPHLAYFNHSKVVEKLITD